MRFVLDNCVDAAVGKEIRRQGHQCWTAADAGLADADDDDLGAYSMEQQAVLMTHDNEFSARRRVNTIGKHVHLDVEEPDAADMIRCALPAMVKALSAADNLFMRVNVNGVIDLHFGWA
ncbi:MAG: DUF5615 family PIN-like protein [Micropruina sp.]|nr:DUF5615 family PIN-like protein [Micropruina sp.]